MIKEEALAEYLRWEANIAPELMTAFKPILVAMANMAHVHPQLF
jgi:hypothetical protein